MTVCILHTINHVSNHSWLWKVAISVGYIICGFWTVYFGCVAAISARSRWLLSVCSPVLVVVLNIEGAKSGKSCRLALLFKLALPRCFFAAGNGSVNSGRKAFQLFHLVRVLERHVLVS